MLGSVTDPAVAFVQDNVTFVQSKEAVALCLTLSLPDPQPSESIISIQYQLTFKDSVSADHHVKLKLYLVHLCVVPLLNHSQLYVKYLAIAITTLGVADNQCAIFTDPVVAFIALVVCNIAIFDVNAGAVNVGAEVAPLLVNTVQLAHNVNSVKAQDQLL